MRYELGDADSADDDDSLCVELTPEDGVRLIWWLVVHAESWVC